MSATRGGSAGKWAGQAAAAVCLTVGFAFSAVRGHHTFVGLGGPADQQSIPDAVAGSQYTADLHQQRAISGTMGTVYGAVAAVVIVLGLGYALNRASRAVRASRAQREVPTSRPFSVDLGGLARLSAGARWASAAAIVVLIGIVAVSAGRFLVSIFGPLLNGLLRRAGDDGAAVAPFVCSVIIAFAAFVIVGSMVTGASRLLATGREFGAAVRYGITAATVLPGPNYVIARLARDLHPRPGVGDDGAVNGDEGPPTARQI